MTSKTLESISHLLSQEEFTTSRLVLSNTSLHARIYSVLLQQYAASELDANRLDCDKLARANVQQSWELNSIGPSTTEPAESARKYAKLYSQAIESNENLIEMAAEVGANPPTTVVAPQGAWVPSPTLHSTFLDDLDDRQQDCLFRGLSGWLSDPDGLSLTIAEMSPLPDPEVIRPLFRLWHGVHGSSSLLDFLHRLVVAIITRDGSAAEPDHQSPKEREVDTWLCGLLDLVDGLGYQVQLASPAASDADGGHRLGPMAFDHVRIDMWLLHIVSELRKSKAETIREKTTIEVEKGLESNGTWMKPMSSVAEALAGYGSRFLSPSTAGSKIGYSDPRRASPFSSLDRHTPSAALALETVRDLILLFRVEKSGTVPLSQALINFLLAKAFPEETNTAVHRRLLLVCVTRWWAFQRLGKMLLRVGTGCLGLHRRGGRDYIEVGLTDSTASPGASDAGHGQPATLLDEVWVSGEESDFLALVHKELYESILKATSFNWLKSEARKSQTDGNVALGNLTATFVKETFLTPLPPVLVSPGSGSCNTRAVLVRRDEMADILALLGMPPTPLGEGCDNEPVHPSPTFKRSSAFGGSNSSFSRSPSFRMDREDDLAGLCYALRSRARDHAASPAKITLKGFAVLFTWRSRTHEIKISPSIPWEPRSLQGLSEESTVACRPANSSTPPRPRLSATKGSSDWQYSPMLSPRHEALRAGGREQSGFFSLGDIAELEEDEQGVQAPGCSVIGESSQNGGGGWLRGKIVKEDVSAPLPSMATLLSLRPPLSGSELHLVRRGILMAARQHHSADCVGGLVARLECLSAIAETNTRYQDAQILKQALAILRNLANERSEWAAHDFAALLATFESALKKSDRERKSALAALGDACLHVEAERRTTLESARATRAALDRIRARVWWCEARHFPEITACVQNIEQICARPGNRLEGEARAERVEAWKRQIGAEDVAGEGHMGVTLPCLELVQEAVGKLMDRDPFVLHPIWRQEKVLLMRHQAMMTRDLGATKTLATHLAGSTSAAKESRPGTTVPSSAPRPTPSTEQAMFSFGAACAALARESEKPQLSETFARFEQFAERRQLAITSYFISDLQSRGLLLPEPELDPGVWLDEFGLNTETSQAPGLVRKRATSAPAAFKELMEAFARHPSLTKKLHAAFELELLLAAALSGSSGRHKPSPGPDAAKLKRQAEAKGRTELPEWEGYLSKLGNFLGYRASKALSVAGSDAEGDVCGPNTSLSSPARPSHDSGLLAVPVDSAKARAARAKRLSLLSIGTDDPKDHGNGLARPLTEEYLSFGGGLDAYDRGKAPCTDDLLVAIEDLLRNPSVRPKGFFHALQISMVLIPSRVLDLQDEGKCWWDLAIAGLAMKRDAVGKVVDRAQRLLETVGEQGVQDSTEVQRLVKIAAREKNPWALEMVKTLGIQDNVDN